MAFSPLAFAFQAANFLVLLWLLKRWFYAPLLAAIDRRRDELAAARTAANAAREAADAARRAADARRAEIEAERAALLDRARTDAMGERARIAEAARADAQGRIAAAETRLQAERRAAEHAVRGEAARLGTTFAARLLESLPADALAAGFEAAFERWLDAQPAEARAALLAGTVAPRIATAQQPDARAREAWRAMFARAAPGLPAPDFLHEPALGAGFEALLPGGAVRFSLRAAAETLRAGAGHD